MQEPDRLISGQAAPDDVAIDRAIRPKTLDEYVGQAQVVANLRVAIEAVDEVGNPTILATLTVIAAVLPMAFVRGLMGPYMRPMALNVPLAMLMSMVVAFTITPSSTVIPLSAICRFRSSSRVPGRDIWPLMFSTRWPMNSLNSTAG